MGRLWFMFIIPEGGRGLGTDPAVYYGVNNDSAVTIINKPAVTIFKKPAVAIFNKPAVNIFKNPAVSHY